MQLGEDFGSEGLQLVFLAEEIGLIRREGLGRMFELRFAIGMEAEIVMVFLETLETEHLETLPKAALRDKARIIRVVDAAERVDEIADRAEFLEFELRAAIEEYAHALSPCARMARSISARTSVSSSRARCSRINVASAGSSRVERRRIAKRRIDGEGCSSPIAIIDASSSESE